MIEILNTVGSLLYTDKHLALKPGDMVDLDADLENTLIKRGLAVKITPGQEIPKEDPEDAPESDQEEKTDEPEEDPEDAPVIEAEAPVSKTKKKTSSRKKGTK